ncbi:hypothetical protein ACFQJ7_10635 [Halovenus rubra]|uniref:Flagellin N-terminal-like domain-containing protein n=2 Tax=Halovenus rubra TaxID=869890 RepID=A0ABD5X691_9EURY|nr:hypothetical protein [Halovenus rubra]
MQRSQFDNRAMSAFGSILLLLFAIFLLVGTAALFFGALGSDYEQVDPPSVTMAYEYVENPSGDEAVMIKLVRGGQINPKQLRVEVEGANCTAGGTPNDAYNGYDDFGIGEKNWLTAGNTLTIDGDNPEPLCADGRLVLSEVDIDLVWLNPSGNDVILSSWSATES